MGKNRDRMSKLSALPPDLLAADMADELEAKIGDLQKVIQTMQDQIFALDRKVSGCCADSTLKLGTLAAEVEALRKLVPTPNPSG
ncbi:MAG: hypothetical protein JNJ46_04415 [Myxococcales bacterium]|nr:hypothetical protein [Myxococcales bacterium]